MLELMATSSGFGGAQYWESLKAVSPLPHLADFAIRVLSKPAGVGDIERFHKVMKRCVNPVARKSMSFANVEKQMFIACNSRKMDTVYEPTWVPAITGFDTLEDREESSSEEESEEDDEGEDGGGPGS